MTAQPQPTAALRDAQLIRDVQATLDDMEAHDVALTAGNLIDALDYHGIRLDRAESAPGVTIPLTLAKDIEALCRVALWISTANQVRDAIDAALADAGTDSETGVGK